ncbi:hypothetical protein HanIR_Chr11g0550561 [Helianthus annuus]|nr:hypothetical protein HanIR_Chr11g0550561 [Helianthus annuus]
MHEHQTPRALEPPLLLTQPPFKVLLVVTTIDSVFMVCNQLSLCPSASLSSCLISSTLMC